MHLSLIWSLLWKHGIPASSKSRCLLQQTARSEQRRGWGFHAHKGPTGPQQISESRRLLEQTSSYELNLRRWEQRNVEARSEATLPVNECGWAPEGL